MRKAALLLLTLACGSPGVHVDDDAEAPADAAPPYDAGAPDAAAESDAPADAGAHVQTVFLILMENHNFADIEGNTKSAPYINGTLLPMAAYAKNYKNPPGIHPSEPNYIWLEAGDNLGVTNDSDPSANHQSTKTHLVSQLEGAGITWKSYQEDIDGKTCPLSDSGLYAVRHNPAVYFDDMTDNQSAASAHCIAHVRPYTELAADLSANKVSRYNFITPNICNDMHGQILGLTCNVLTTDLIAKGDTWLKNNIPTIMQSAAYKNGGAIFITWDEGEGSDGPIGMIVVSPLGKGAGYTNTIAYTHSSTLRTMERIFGVQYIRDAKNATDLADLFSAL